MYFKIIVVISVNLNMGFMICVCHTNIEILFALKVI